MREKGAVVPMRAPRIRRLLIALLALATTLAALAPLAAGDAPPALRILARYAVSPSPSPATDVRWASDDSVYLSRRHDGVAEMALGEDLVKRRQIVPRGEDFGDFWSFAHLAVSRETLLVASENFDLSWTPRDPAADGTRVFSPWPVQLVDDVDVFGRRVLFLGYPAHGDGSLVAAGAPVAWIGSLEDKGGKDLLPVLRDKTRHGFLNSYRACPLFELGAVRFLADGSFVVVPGTQPGAYLFDRAGMLARQWDTRALGLDTDCSTVKDEGGTPKAQRPEERLAYVNSHRTLDEILPLPEGPGLVVRWVARGRVHWQIEVLRPEGVTSYTVPFTSDRLFERLRGDVKDGRIVLLRSAQTSYASGGMTSPEELIVAELPGAASSASAGGEAP